MYLKIEEEYYAQVELLRSQIFDGDEDTFDEETTDVMDDSLISFDSVIPGVVSIHNKKVWVRVPIKLPRNQMEMFKDPIQK